ncbi:hypothetical protein [Duganella callida]|uniref:Uncharacterized protein n=1 Tax=Duganella callida TaxID=2561932 RepID=A0A4Y9SNI3_9BURK|nr:hypothetical protein [Duganella callida]TFW26504.1 hypothetical protein E4L98_08560 [Duganella callida]
MENPYLTPPQVEGPQSRSWGAGFLFGFQGPALSTTAQADVDTEDVDAFNEGVLAGQDAAINGLPFEPSCVDLNVERPEWPHVLATESFGVGMTIRDFIRFARLTGPKAAEALAGGILGGILDIVTVSLALETFNDDPEQAIVEAGTTLQDALQRMGYDVGMELYIGGGLQIAPETTGCEISLTAIYRSQEAASAAAKAIGRPNYLVAGWRTDQSGGISVLEHD